MMTWKEPTHVLFLDKTATFLSQCLTTFELQGELLASVV